MSRYTTIIAALSGAVTAPGIMLISDFSFIPSIMIAGIASASIGGLLAIHAEREYQRQRGEDV